MSSPLHCEASGLKVGSVEVVVVVVELLEVAELATVRVEDFVVDDPEVVDVFRVVGRGVIRQEHADDTLGAEYWET